ncbi:NAD(P)H-dependent glycerol-3-phosphate dehydrogenase [Marinicrinis lubricantis]|uniref:Glycerol-3-phosphate dehydrogenase [NAD(P)+] n=1 Tax=Marinicrinis lubricantis TaxID=2086470 RepID=A0ABW1ISM1_9BACL
MKKAAVLVAGSWGTALASVLADKQYDVCLWSRNEQQVKEINEQHTNQRYLPNATLSSLIRSTTSMEAAVVDAEIIVVVAPSHAMRDVMRQCAPYYREGTLIVHATKGFEPETLNRMSEIIREEIPSSAKHLAVLSGPSHAEEVIQKLPTTVVVASHYKAAAEKAQDAFIHPYFRVYTNPDLVGVEVGGALKNIIALATGLANGLGLGDNAKAALITRGLAEIARLGTAMGSSPLTFSGLAGVGDLVVTCTSQHSRNWRAGYMLGQGAKLDEVLERMGMVVEGVKTTKAAHFLTRKYQVEMPITEQLYEVLFNGKDSKMAVEDLMVRVKTHEMEEIVAPQYASWLE